jgi:hypothetical protein
MAEVAVRRPAASASRIPAVTAGDKAKSSAQSAKLVEVDMAAPGQTQIRPFLAHFCAAA